MTIWGKLPRGGRPFRLTGGGWVFILYTIGVGAGAINTGNNLLYLVFGVFLGMILASGLLSDLSLWGVEATPQFPVSVEAGLPALLPFRVRNSKKYLPSISVSIEAEGELHGEKITLRAFVPYLRPGETEMAYFHFVPSRRGMFRLRRVVATTIYPFGLLRKRWGLREQVAPGVEFLVYPAPVPVSMNFAERYAAGSEVAIETLGAGDGTSISGLREYRSGDNPRRIHWKASAKRLRESAQEPGWLLRETDREQQREVVLTWPARERMDALPGVLQETFISFTASLLQLLSAQDVRVLFRVEGEAPRTLDLEKNPMAALGFLSVWPDTRSFLTEFEFEGRRDAGTDLIALFEAWKAEGK